MVRRMLSSSAAISAVVSYTCARLLELPKSHRTHLPSALRNTFSAFSGMPGRMGG